MDRCARVGRRRTIPVKSTTHASNRRKARVRRILPVATHELVLNSTADLRAVLAGWMLLQHAARWDCAPCPRASAPFAVFAGVWPRTILAPDPRERSKTMNITK